MLALPRFRLWACGDCGSISDDYFCGQAHVSHLPAQLSDCSGPMDCDQRGGGGALPWSDAAADGAAPRRSEGDGYLQLDCVGVFGAGDWPGGGDHAAAADAGFSWAGAGARRGVARDLAFVDLRRGGSGGWKDYRAALFWSGNCVASERLFGGSDARAIARRGLRVCRLQRDIFRAGSVCGVPAARVFARAVEFAVGELEERCDRDFRGDGDRLLPGFDAQREFFATNASSTVRGGTVIVYLSSLRHRFAGDDFYLFDSVAALREVDGAGDGVPAGSCKLSGPACIRIVDALRYDWACGAVGDHGVPHVFSSGRDEIIS